MHDFAQIDRRMLLRRAMLLLGAAAVPADLFAAAAKATEGALAAHQFELLSAVADTIVPVTDTPGALAAGVPKLVDAMLRDWASPARRAEMIAALDAIDVAAMAKAGKAFAALPPAQRHDLLKPHDVAALRPDPTRKPDALSPMPPATDPGYAKLKELIVILYYQSEIALSTELSYEHAPGKWQPSIPVTPDTRPAGGFGLY